MTAATTSPVNSTPQSSPSRRKPLPLRQLDLAPADWDQNGVVAPNSARLRKSPISPVKVNFQPENWAQPESVHIENSQRGHERQRDGVPGLGERPLPDTPGAPRPPCHSTKRASYSRQPGKTRNCPDLHPSSYFDHDLLIKEPSLWAGERQGHERAARQDTNGSRYTRPSQSSVIMFGSEEDRTSAELPNKDLNRHSRESDTTASTSQQHTSIESSATTSASSVVGVNDAPDSACIVGEGWTESLVMDGTLTRIEPESQFQYHHFSIPARPPSVPTKTKSPSCNTPDLIEYGTGVTRRLTPGTPGSRPPSTLSIYSDLGARSRSPGQFSGSHHHGPSSQLRRSPDSRPVSYAELLNVPYPQPTPAPITLDNSQLRTVVGSNASLLSTQKTLEMYRQNVKKTNDASIQYSFAVFLIATAQDQGVTFDEPKRTKSPKPSRDLESPNPESSATSPQDLVREARAILQKLSNNGYPFAQYYLADGYASGLFNKGKEDYNSAFPLFVLAAKHGHAESAYRTGLCYEFGWGCRKDPTKAVQFLRTAASKRHPGAMTRLGKACLSGDLGEKRYREGIKWLKLATESADAVYNAAPYHLGSLYETGYGDDIFQDESYAAELFTQAADLGHPEANYRMGDAYEHGKLTCPRDPALSVHFYTGAAERGHAAAMMGLCAWYMVGAEPILEKDEEEAYEWARRSAEQGFVKAEYAVGYFTEMGIGCRRDILEANVWYVKAAESGDERAKQRLAAIRAAVSGGTQMEVGQARNARIKKNGAEKDDKECVVM